MIYIFLFILGTAVGSFLGVLVDRLPFGEDILRTRSRCDFCRQKLNAWDLIPLLSFILLKGKCRYCKKRFSLFYPGIEFMTGLLFVILLGYVSKWLTIAPDIFQFIYLTSVFSMLTVVLLADFKYRIIPDQMVLTLSATILVYQILSAPHLVVSNLISAAGASILFLLLVLATRGKGMGWGDVKFAFVMGLFLGYPAIIIGLYLAFLTGAVFSLILILVGLKKFKSTIAFAPFLVLATVVTFFYANPILEYVYRLFLFNI